MAATKKTTKKTTTKLSTRSGAKSKTKAKPKVRVSKSKTTKAAATKTKRTTTKKATTKAKTPVKKTTAKKTTTRKTTSTAKKIAAKAPAKTTKIKETPKKKVAAKSTTRATKSKPTKKPVLKSVAKAKPTPTPVAKLVTPAPAPVNDNYMTKEHLAHFKAILEDRKRVLMEQAEATMRDMQVANEENQADISDIATTEERWYYQLRTRDRERKLIKKIEESLQKIVDNEYGYCESCGVEIGLNRLEARPTANQCIDCKTLDEIREKTQAD